jgi:hypothetical protein
VTFAGDTGTPFATSSVTIHANSQSGASVLFDASTPALTLKVTDNNGNTFIGLGTGAGGGTDTFNTAFGRSCLSSITSGDYNIALGANAMNGADGLSRSIAIGRFVLQANNIGGDADNIGIGDNALAALSGASGIVAIGTNALFTSVTDTGNTCVGFENLKVLDGGNNNTTLGYSVLKASTGDSNNTGIGYNVLSTMNGGSGNVAVGSQAMQSSTSGNNNVAIGFESCFTATSGSDNVAVGTFSLYTSPGSVGCVAVGSQALYSNTADGITAVGYYALQNSVADNYNTAIGWGSGTGLNGGSSNTILGYQAMNGAGSGSNNTAIGANALLTSGTSATNVAVGVSALQSLSSGSGNVAVGYQSGSNFTGAESSNVLLNAQGVVADSHTLRIGEATGTGSRQLNTAYIQGIYSNTQNPSGTVEFVTINNTTGKLGVSTSSGNVTIAGDSGTIVGNSLTIYANTATQNSGSTVKFVNSGTTSTLNVSDSNANTLIGNTAGNGSVSGTINTGLGFQSLNALTSGTTNTAIGGRSLVGLLTGTNNLALGYGAGSGCTGSESSNIYLNNGGATENHTLRIGAGTGVGAGQLSTAYIHGIVGNTVSNANVVTINTATGQLGVIGVPSGLITFSADTGASFGVSSVTFTTGYSTNAAGQSVLFASNGTNTITLDVTDSNNSTFIGNLAGKSGASGTNNTSLGYKAMGAVTTAPSSVAIGAQALASCTTSPYNVAIGFQAMQTHTVGYAGDGNNVAIGYQSMKNDQHSVLNVMVGFQSGIQLSDAYGNTAVGHQALSGLVVGQYNCCIGYNAGESLSLGETGNTYINSRGVTGESHAIRIGDGTGTSVQNASTCYISGVANPTLSSGTPTPYLMMQDISNDQIQALTPVDANTASTAFGSLVVGTALQNTSLYPILVNVSMDVTAATGAVILVGVGSTNTPTAQAVTASLTVAASTHFGFSFVVPAMFYAKVTTTGTITVGSITTLATQIG